MPGSASLAALLAALTCTTDLHTTVIKHSTLGQGCGIRATNHEEHVKVSGQPWPGSKFINFRRNGQKETLVPHQARHNCCTLSRDRNQRTNTPVINMILTDQHPASYSFPAFSYNADEILLCSVYLEKILFLIISDRVSSRFATLRMYILSSTFFFFFLCNYEPLACEKYS